MNTSDITQGASGRLFFAAHLPPISSHRICRGRKLQSVNGRIFLDIAIAVVYRFTVFDQTHQEALHNA
ncbi:MAG: hypothetical protein EA403_02270 [Spirochaetaceae bacterium]|nr:MAG: hypothetical protein EA403_02270 [Spirochaetaceae bacterium]